MTSSPSSSTSQCPATAVALVCAGEQRAEVLATEPLEDEVHQRAAMPCFELVDIRDIILLVDTGTF